MKVRVLLVLFAVLPISPAASPAFAQHVEFAEPLQTTDLEGFNLGNGFQRRVLFEDGKFTRYAVWLPPDYSPAHEYPLVVYLHGAGERGSDGVQQTTVGLGPALVQWPERFPAIVVMPQCPKKTVWKQAFATIDKVYAATLREFRIDRRRVYLTGNSLGGFGTWSYGALHPTRFAAFLIVSGGATSEEAMICAQNPTWVFANALDPIVFTPVVRWSVLAARVVDEDVLYTEYDTFGHDAWTPTYSDPDAMAWLFSHARDRVDETDHGSDEIDAFIPVD